MPSVSASRFFAVAVVGDPCDYARLRDELDFLLSRRVPAVVLLSFLGSDLFRLVDRYAHERKLLQEPVPVDHGLAGIFYLNPDAVVVVNAGGVGRLEQEVRARRWPVRVLDVRAGVAKTRSADMVDN
jgi:hypothetical protein